MTAALLNLIDKENVLIIIWQTEPHVSVREKKLVSSCKRNQEQESTKINHYNHFDKVRHYSKEGY